MEGLLRSSWGFERMYAALVAVAHSGDVGLLFLLLAVLFVVGGLYLLFARGEWVGAVVAVLIAVLIVVFLA